MGNSLVTLAKKISFAFLRLRQEASLYESKQVNSNIVLRVLHVGDFFRGRDFIERLYGFLPERKVIGKRFVCPFTKLMEFFDGNVDLIMVEINRLFAETFRQAGYFTIPQWVEFGRDVVRAIEKRYAGANKSLKSDLKKSRNADFEVVITRDLDDFYLFYERMYLPYLAKRFGDTMIAKTRKRLKKDFSAGFLMLIEDKQQPIAGAIVRINGGTVTETALGVLDGLDEFLGMGVSGVIDYHLHEWAANHDKCYINVGHTRPFPLDGIFFNKRKWLMSVMPDYDGVMDIAVKICRYDAQMAKALKDYPFVFQSKSGLGVFCTYVGPDKAGISETQMLWRRFWTRGLKDLIIVSPTGYHEKTIEKTKELFGPWIHLFTDIGQAVELQRARYEV
ncbi:MAG: hypothetical protein ACFFCW_07850 [Candidatus Hodarchaeota archaeon]